MARHRRHVAHEEEHENHERWLITYADMITLLMAFFVMMYGMSIVDLKKFADFKEGAAKQLGKSPAVSGGEGILLGGDGVAEVAAPPIGTGAREGGEDAAATGEVTQANVGALVKEVQRRLEENGLGGAAQLEVDPRGLVVYLLDRVLFESGSAWLEPEGQRVLDQLALTLAHIDNEVVIAGHTDDRPTRGRNFPTNWELSTARATQVLRWITEVRGLPGARFSAAGYADTHPRFPNDSDDHMALNRRVEIVVVTPPEAAGSGTGSAVPANPDITPNLAPSVPTHA